MTLNIGLFYHIGMKRGFPFRDVLPPCLLASSSTCLLALTPLAVIVLLLAAVPRLMVWLLTLPANPMTSTMRDYVMVQQLKVPAPRSINMPSDKQKAVETSKGRDTVPYGFSI